MHQRYRIPIIDDNVYYCMERTKGTAVPIIDDNEWGIFSLFEEVLPSSRIFLTQL